MISKKAICVLFISLMLTAILGCVAQETTGSLSVPTKNLPEGFKLAAVETKFTKGVTLPTRSRTSDQRT